MKKLQLIFSYLLIQMGVATFGQGFTEVQKFNASDRGASDFFGFGSDFNGNLGIVGSFQNDLDANQLNILSNAGAAYIFNRNSSGAWLETQKIVHSDRHIDDKFGNKVSIDGAISLVACYNQDYDTLGSINMANAGAAYIFAADSLGVWSESQKLVAPDRDTGDLFGIDLKIRNGVAVIGASSEDEDAAGINPLSNAGAVYIFEEDSTGKFVFTQKIVASDRLANDYFGNKIEYQNGTIAVGAYQSGLDSLGANLISKAGAVYLFEKNSSGIWIEVQKVVASDRSSIDYFGISTSIFNNTMVVGAYWEDENANGTTTILNAGSAYIFEKNAQGNWVEKQKIVASDRGQNHHFGYSVSVYGDVIAAGAIQNSSDENGQNLIASAGAGYIFQKDLNGQWSQTQKIVGSNRGTNDWFGTTMKVENDVVYSSVRRHDLDSTGNNSVTDAGIIYAFKDCFPTSDSIQIVACDSFSLNTSNKFFKTSGIHYDTLVNSEGCDSVVKINLTINNGYFESYSAISCGPYHSPSGNSTYTTTGIYLDSMQSSMGCDSVYEINLLIGDVTTTSLTIDACKRYKSPSGRYNFTQTGNYVDTLLSSIGCDSVLNISLTITSLDSSVTKNANTLTSNQSNAVYQWVTCSSSYAPIAGETSQSFSALVAGLYAVIITKDGCKDTSACFQLLGTGVEVWDKSSISVYPNPISDRLLIELKNEKFIGASLTIYNLEGKVVLSQHLDKKKNNIWISSNLKNGLYFLSVNSRSGQFSRKIQIID